MATIITPRPPLNLFEVVRRNLTSDWQTIYDVPYYLVPAEGPTPDQTIETAAIMTGFIVTPQGGNAARVSIRILDLNDTPFPMIDQAYAPLNDFLSVVLDRQVARSGEKIQAKIEADEDALLHFSFILNQREQFTVL